MTDQREERAFTGRSLSRRLSRPVEGKRSRAVQFIYPFLSRVRTGSCRRDPILLLSSFIWGALGVGCAASPTRGSGPPTTLDVNAGPDQTIALSAAVQLNGSAVSSGAPYKLKAFWSKISGPGVATFSHEQFNSSFEDGTVDEWVGDGGGAQSGGGSVTQEQAHSGRYSWKAYNDPSLPSPDNISAKLLRWRFDNDSAYESAWFFWPIDYFVNGHAGNYANIFQWKENSTTFNPTWVVAVVGAVNRPGEDEFAIHDWYRQRIIRTGVLVPKGRWFRIAAFMREGYTDGDLMVWIDDQVVFNRNGLNTLGDATTQLLPHLMWGVGNYSDAGVGYSIYVDDAVVVPAARDVMATSATFSEPGAYVLRLTASDGEKTVSDDIQIDVR